MDAVARQDIRNTILVLAYCKHDHINTPYSKTDTRTALHIAAALGNLVLVQLLLWVCTAAYLFPPADFSFECECQYCDIHGKSYQLYYIFSYLLILLVLLIRGAFKKF